MWSTQTRNILDILDILGTTGVLNERLIVMKKHWIWGGGVVISHAKQLFAWFACVSLHFHQHFWPSSLKTFATSIFNYFHTHFSPYFTEIFKHMGQT